MAVWGERASPPTPFHMKPKSPSVCVEVTNQSLLLQIHAQPYNQLHHNHGSVHNGYIIMLTVMSRFLLQIMYIMYLGPSAASIRTTSQRVDPVC